MLIRASTRRWALADRGGARLADEVTVIARMAQPQQPGIEPPGALLRALIVDLSHLPIRHNRNTINLAIVFFGEELHLNLKRMSVSVVACPRFEPTGCLV
jgi:hypothetical protein